MPDRTSDLESELAALRARQLSATVALRSCEPCAPESKLRAKRVYELAVARSGGASHVANEEQCHESTIRYRIAIPARNVHLEHVYDMPAEGMALVIDDLTTAMETKLRRTRRAS